MEITLLSPLSPRLKGKHTTLVVNPQDRNVAHTGALLLGDVDKKILKLNDNAVVIEGPGEYEVGGIKFTGTRLESDLSYSLVIDEVSILLITDKTLVKTHQKLRDYDVVVVYVVLNDDPSVGVNVANSAVLYFGESAGDIVKRFVKEGVQEMNKYVITKDKLPTEVAQICLK